MLFDLAYSWFAPQSAPAPVQVVPDNEPFELIDAEPEQHAEWLDAPETPEPRADLYVIAPQLTPAFNHHKRKRHPKLSKAQKKSRRHLRAMWP